VVSVDRRKDPYVPDRWINVTMSSVALPWGGGTNPSQFELVILTGTYFDGGARIEESMLRLRCHSGDFVSDSHVPPTPADLVQIAQEMVTHMGQCQRNARKAA
jgi:hypothetical protein